MCLSGCYGNHWQLVENSLHCICIFIAVISCWIESPLLPGGEYCIYLFGCVSPDGLTLTGDDWGVKGLSHH